MKTDKSEHTEMMIHLYIDLRLYILRKYLYLLQILSGAALELLSIKDFRADVLCLQGLC